MREAEKSHNEKKTDAVVLEAFFKMCEILIQPHSDQQELPNSTTKKKRPRFNFDLGVELEWLRTLLKRNQQKTNIRLVFYVKKNDEHIQLLEEWSLNYERSTRNRKEKNDEEVISALRLDCKQIGVLLRVLYSSRRLLPSFSLRPVHFQIVCGGGGSKDAIGRCPCCFTTTTLRNSSSQLLKHQYTFVPIETPFGLIKLAAKYTDRLPPSITTTTDSHHTKKNLLADCIIQDDYLSPSPRSSLPMPIPSTHTKTETTDPLLRTNTCPPALLKKAAQPLHYAHSFDDRSANEAKATVTTPAPYGYSNINISSPQNGPPRQSNSFSDIPPRHPNTTSPNLTSICLEIEKEEVAKVNSNEMSPLMTPPFCCSNSLHATNKNCPPHLSPKLTPTRNNNLAMEPPSPLSLGGNKHSKPTTIVATTFLSSSPPFPSNPSQLVPSASSGTSSKSHWTKLIHPQKPYNTTQILTKYNKTGWSQMLSSSRRNLQMKRNHEETPPNASTNSIWGVLADENEELTPFRRLYTATPTFDEDDEGLDNEGLFFLPKQNEEDSTIGIVRLGGLLEELKNAPPLDCFHSQVPPLSNNVKEHPNAVDYEKQLDRFRTLREEILHS